MKKILLWILVPVMVLSLSACGDATPKETSNAGLVQPSSEVGEKLSVQGEHLAGKDTLNIMLFFTGTFGNYSNHDNIYNYLSSEFVEETGCNFEYYECAGDTAIYESALLELCASGKYDIIVLGNYALAEYVVAAAEQFPDQHFLVYDTEIDYESGVCQNVTSIQLAQNELAFKVGVLAALMTESNAELANEDKAVAYVGPGINTATVDFLYGYIDGVNYVDSEIEVLYSFVGDWSDTAKAKELTLNAVQQGADVVYGVCGAAGLGVCEAALDSKIYAIGVDYDQQAALEKSAQPSAQYVLTSSMKDFPQIIGDSLKAMMAGTYDKWGVHTWVDASYEGGDYLSLLETSNFIAMVPAEVLEQYNAIVEDLRAGKIEVDTAIGATEDDWNTKYAEAAPFTN